MTTRFWLDHQRIVDNTTGNTVLLITYPNGTPVDWPVNESEIPLADQEDVLFGLALIGLMNAHQLMTAEVK